MEEVKRYRQLIRVVGRQDNPGYVGNGAWCVCPGWAADVAVLVPAQTFGDDWSRTQVGARLFAQVTLGIEDAREFIIEGPFEF